jgi:predicted HicB family RNase H-like nuclease
VTSRQPRKATYLGERRQLTLRLDPKLAAAIDAETQRRNMSTQTWLLGLVADHLNSGARS